MVSGRDDRRKLLRAKTELLCWGFKPNEALEEVFIAQNPYHDRRTGNAGVQVALAEKLVANVPTGNRYNAYSPYTLEKQQGMFYIVKDEVLIARCEPVPAPQWYHQLTSDGTPMGAVILQEGFNTLIAAIYNRCAYWRDEDQCLFCAINSAGAAKRKSPQQFAEAVEAAFTVDPRSTLDLTAGNTLLPDRGALTYLDVLRAIKERVNIPICVEISPPDEDKHLDMLVEAGADAFMMNLEIGDDQLRRLFCPGKFKIPKDRYFDAWKHALELVGRSKVSSVLIAGLESRESTLRTAQELIEFGIIPTIMPLRPNDGCYLENFVVPSPDNIEYMSSRVGQLLYKYNLDCRSHPGCISCAACAIEVDYRELEMIAADSAAL